ncbi:hypothetical protein COCCADRAFT_97193 [Bipolaris zeicola 26-R-13]|uniref:Uncharacterized protein n=1 Tax=Cochliobolus carbonum (strain 26-R-13) TaxID=930089 RepID=W6XZR2_COCC2|nr:uncharacterized protein COCCADRAFT_97193 [Bipolaris zeicola 26-R-13]EUC32992.1 hypothetical protein COCCADRAFT_97193 [Bipolaris zeicola 26-R-13]
MNLGNDIGILMKGSFVLAVELRLLGNISGLVSSLTVVMGEILWGSVPYVSGTQSIWRSILSLDWLFFLLFTEVG